MVKRVLAVGLQPLRLLLQRLHRLRRELGRIGLEEYAVADIDDEILLAARRRAGIRPATPIVGFVGAARDRQRCDQYAGNPRSAEETRDARHHSGASLLHLVPGRDRRSSRQLVKRRFCQP